jgi:hypothetical protein
MGETTRQSDARKPQALTEQALTFLPSVDFAEFLNNQYRPYD